ncbi:urea transporter, partial [Escherichia coli]|uniref:urea transporter n=1 Tax=Escherichia coli TaxID=562 RepID=UPI00201A549F
PSFACLRCWSEHIKNRQLHNFNYSLSFNMGHPEILYFSAISAALSPFFAWCLQYPDEEINEGIWGYNAVLYVSVQRGPY